jgi:Uma2 family endonuclease
MSLHEIVLAPTKPETEWVRGRALQKVSPTYSHAALQRLLGTALGTWADDGGHGRVGTEWRFRVAPPGQLVRPLVPDVAYLAYETLSRDASPEEFEVPLGAPTLAIEILSPDDRVRDVADKIETYLAAGCAAVLVALPAASQIEVHERSSTRVLRTGDVLELTVLPGFTLDVGDLFARAGG